MTETDYLPPIDQLLTYSTGRPPLAWPNYLALGLGSEHVPDLIRMATDDELFELDVDGSMTWAPVHAWRALGQLRAEAACEPLVRLLHRIDDEDDEWVGEELPEVLGMIGPAAVPGLAAFLSDDAHGLWARVAAAAALQHIGQQHPAARDECIAILSRQLESFASQDPTLNAFLIDPLLDLKAVEAAPVMERAFAANVVDEWATGDWEDAQVRLGLKATREKSRPQLSGWLDPATEAPSVAPVPPRPARSKDQKKKNKRNQAKSSRKKNRRK
ncbi:MAG: DUF1186 domain-containing protein [Chloroflexi bacterium]|nr:DUF1186 domain-containing protein [Chloroflexota bacterium]MBU1751240.1 DUF1186 domain-containing protein [Chloroflexota bacterium]